MSRKVRDDDPSDSSVNNDQVEWVWKEGDAPNSYPKWRIANCEKMNALMSRRFQTSAHLGNGVALNVGWPPEVCQEVIRKWQEHGSYMQGEIFTPGDDGAIHSPQTHIRSAGVWQYDDEWVYKLVMEAFLEANNKCFGFELWDIEPPQLCVYYADQGGRYTWHPDIQDLPIEMDPDKMRRKLSMSILLNDATEFEGGEFQLFEGVHGSGEPAVYTAPLQKAGDAIVFDSTAYHRVKTVTKGVRAALVIWCWGKR